MISIVEQGSSILDFMRITVDSTALLAFLLSKHITICDYVILKGYVLIATY
jgi:hypothetical protein